MLTIKNGTGGGPARQRARARFPSVAVLGVLLPLVLLCGCAPSGTRALLEGKRLIDKGQYAQAIEKLKTATTLLGDTNATAWSYLGVAYQHAGAATEAEWAYQRALGLNHGLSEVRFNRGCLWLSQNKLEAAKSELTAYTLAQPNAPEGFVQLGTAQLRSREASAAEKSFAEALRLNQQDPEAWNGLGLARLQRGRATDAAQAFESALKQQKDYGPAILNLAIVEHQYLKDRPLALQKYREYLALKPLPPNADALSATVRQLDQELNPPARQLATNVASVPSLITHTAKPPAALPVRTVKAPKAEAPIDVPRPAATNKPKVESAAAAPKPATLSAPKPALALASPLPTAVQTSGSPAEPKSNRASEIAKSPPPTPASPAEPTITTSTPPASTTSPKTSKRGFLQQINPANLFRGSERTPPKPIALNSPGGSSKGEAIAAAPVAPSKVPAGRYAYQSPAVPAEGDHVEAERIFAEGVDAYQKHHLSEAIKIYVQATRQDPSLYEAHYNLGLVATEAGNLPLALTSYETALAIRPTSLDARYNFALVLKQANYLTDAVIELEKVVARYPNEARAHLALGNLYAQQLGQAAKARPHYLKVLEVDPQHPQAGAIRFWLTSNPA